MVEYGNRLEKNKVRIVTIDPEYLHKRQHLADNQKDFGRRHPELMINEFLNTHQSLVNNQKRAEHRDDINSIADEDGINGEDKPDVNQDDIGGGND